ncbi:hypothetical protein MHY87_07385 [Microvirga sp. ACRRW]|uniref:hypothetical protein n=1 Tax=Microvirga sp. ACRRW TaxID=2918205 RepID=UPI001EF43BFA|nr:hypothetical protein [Microvirga sp. ACRRW]MCG7392723.1 hypothetical protein [Microvirga sp. ACRRW]
MRKELVALAARNNAEWCDVICRANGRGGEFHDGLWLNQHGTPRFYPDAVTLVGPAADADILDSISAAMAEHSGRGWAVKDSFACIDLAALGFTKLFDAEWISCDPLAEHHSHLGVAARIIRNETELVIWSQAWNEGVSPADIPFKSTLLREPALRFVQVERSGTIIGGGILSEAAGVVGLSNVFTVGADTDAVWQALIGCADESFPDCPLVGYERGEDLDAACRNGFRPIGPLRVWHRPE